MDSRTTALLNRLPSRVAAKIRVQRNGCWQWTATTNGRGYGYVRFDRRNWLAHRLTYVLLVGPIPPGMTIDHVCHTARCRTPGTECPHRRCVNPRHLAVASQRANILRGQSLAAKRARQTSCGRGHKLTPDNIYKSGNHRRCATCHRASVRRYKAARR